MGLWGCGIVVRTKIKKAKEDEKDERKRWCLCDVRSWKRCSQW